LAVKMLTEAELLDLENAKPTTMHARDKPQTELF
jgi:hypothetical protein